jgi:hypothetical protein
MLCHEEGAGWCWSCCDWYCYSSIWSMMLTFVPSLLERDVLWDVLILKMDMYSLSEGGFEVDVQFWKWILCDELLLWWMILLRWMSWRFEMQIAREDCDKMSTNTCTVGSHLKMKAQIIANYEFVRVLSLIDTNCLLLHEWEWEWGWLIEEATIFWWWKENAYVTKCLMPMWQNVYLIRFLEHTNRRWVLGVKSPPFFLKIYCWWIRESNRTTREGCFMNWFVVCLWS